ncbi:MAG: 50S ribosomal protein L34e [Candidatus Micrarchaeia archaeon]
MPQPKNRSRSVRRLDRVTPKGRHVIHYERKAHALPRCAICGAEINGISVTSKLRGKSRKSVERLFGGVLCSRCTARVVTLASRIEHGEMKLNDIGLKERNYVLQMMAH